MRKESVATLDLLRLTGETLWGTLGGVTRNAAQILVGMMALSETFGYNEVGYRSVGSLNEITYQVFSMKNILSILKHKLFLNGVR